MLANESCSKLSTRVVPQPSGLIVDVEVILISDIVMVPRFTRGPVLEVPRSAVRPRPGPLLVGVVASDPDPVCSEGCEEVVGVLVRNRGEVPLVLLPTLGPGHGPGVPDVEIFVAESSVAEIGPASVATLTIVEAKKE